MSRTFLTIAAPLLLVLHSAAALSAADSQERAVVRWSMVNQKQCVEVEGLQASQLGLLRGLKSDSEIWRKWLDIRVVGSSRPLLGSYGIDSNKLIFQPRFSLEPDLEYVASFRPPGSTASAVIAKSTGLVRAAKPATKVLRVDPTAPVVPENLLKIYLTFSAPMSRGQVYDRVSLLDEAGQPLKFPFLELGEELWDPSQTRITLLFDPGRIKSGLRPREEDGPILVAGRNYTLVVDAAWPDASGQPLAAGVRRAIKTGPADLRSPDPKSWVIGSPRMGTLEPLQVRFDEVLDHALATRLIQVQGVDGKTLEGAVEIDDTGRNWQFRPSTKWLAGEYRVSVDVRLEDLAGNSVAKPFEVDTFQVDQPQVKAGSVSLRFRTRSD